jgi:hypothetical protein
VISLSPPPRRTGRASRPAPGSSNWPKLQGLRWHTVGLVLQGYVYPTGYPTFPLDEPSSPRPCDQSPGHVSTLSSCVIERYPTGYECPVPFGCRHSLFGRPIPAAGLARSCDEVTGIYPRSQRGSHVPHRQDALGELASLRREQRTVSVGPLIPADLCFQ